ncbi:MAG TPA: hypothetical protein VIU12_32100 [Chryseolinea sp.]
MRSTQACRYYILALLVTLFSCKNPDPGPQLDLDSLLVVVTPKYDSSSKYHGQLLSLKLGSGNLTTLSNIKGLPVAISKVDDKLLVLAKDNFFWNYHWLNRINLTTDSLEKTTTFTPLEFYDPPSRIALYNHKLYIPGINSYELMDIVNIVNPETMLTEDTLHMPPLEYLTDVVLVGNQLFVKLTDKIRVYNNATLEHTGTIQLQAKSWAGMIVDKNNQILIPDGQIQSINPADLSITTTSAKIDVFQHPGGVQPALDSDANVLYFFDKDDKFDVLKKIDLTTGQVETLSKSNQPSFPSGAGFIRYDKSRNILIVGGGEDIGTITTLTTSGALIKKYPIYIKPLDVVLE